METSSSTHKLHLVLVDTFKGGTGKTTTARWLASRLVFRGDRVLLSGLSPQNDLVVTDSTSVRGVRDVVTTPDQSPTIITLMESLYYIPAGISSLPSEDPGLGAYYRTLGERLQCDWVVIDGLNFLQDAAWWVLDDADVLIVPAMPTPEAVRAGLRTVRAVVRAQNTLGRASKLSVLRILLVDVPSTSRIPAAMKELLEALEAAYGAAILSSRIRHTARRRVGEDDGGLLKAGLRTDLTGPRISEDYDALVAELHNLVNKNIGGE